jgi:hypothetical protein
MREGQAGQRNSPSPFSDAMQRQRKPQCRLLGKAMKALSLGTPMLRLPQTRWWRLPRIGRAAAWRTAPRPAGLRGLHPAARQTSSPPGRPVRPGRRNTGRTMQTDGLRPRRTNQQQPLSAQCSEARRSTQRTRTPVCLSVCLSVASPRSSPAATGPNASL